MIPLPPFIDSYSLLWVKGWMCTGWIGMTFKCSKKTQLHTIKPRKRSCMPNTGCDLARLLLMLWKIHQAKHDDGVRAEPDKTVNLFP